jgi:hypothetical protein
MKDKSYCSIGYCFDWYRNGFWWRRVRSNQVIAQLISIRTETHSNPYMQLNLYTIQQQSPEISSGRPSNPRHSTIPMPKFTPMPTTTTKPVLSLGIPSNPSQSPPSTNNCKWTWQVNKIVRSILQYNRNGFLIPMKNLCEAELNTNYSSSCFLIWYFREIIRNIGS